MKSNNRKTALFLSAITAFNLMVASPVPVTAEARDTPKSVVEKSISNDLMVEDIIPEAIDISEAKEKSHVNRLHEKEDSLETVVFANADGSETTYIFDEPVKYLDENGEISDKSNKLYSDVEANKLDTSKKQKGISNYAYVNAENDIKTYFPKKLSGKDSIKLEAQNRDILMRPSSDVVSSVIEENNVVYYEDVFGEFTSLRYETLFSGYKEDIILEKYVGNEFKFILDVGGLTPVSKNGSFHLTDEDGETFATVSPIYVYGSSKDEAQFTYDNKLEFEKIDGNKYELVITVDDEFLRDPNTVYPVYVDPTITINAAGSGSSKTILDTPIYNGSGVSNQSGGANSTAIIGRVSSSYGSGRLLMRFPGLMSQSFMSNQNYIISSATLHLKEVSGNSASAAISAHIYTGPEWSESSMYSSSIWNGSYKKNGVEQTLSTYTYSYPNYTTGSFNITQAVRLWQSNHSYGNKGIILKNRTSESDGTYYKALYTSEGTTKPYVSVTYTTRSNASEAFLTYGSTTRNITLQLKGSTTTNSTWLPIISASRNAWNNSIANTNITITTTGTSKYTLTVAAFPMERWYGLTTTSHSGAVVVSAKIEINTSTIGSSTAFRRSTVTHEFAHLMWLNDNPSTTDFSLMRHNRDREIIYTPQMIDIYHLLKKY